jgi:hypothetical protein
MFVTTVAAQPPRPVTPVDPLEAAKAQQRIAEQKAQLDLLQTIENADKLAKSGRIGIAKQTLKTAKQNLQLALGISETARTRFTAMLDAKLAAIDGRPLVNPNPNPGVLLDPKGPELKAAQKLAVERAIAELKDVRESTDRIQRYQNAGLTDYADKEISRLAKLYPHNPSVMVLGQTDSMKNRLADALALQKMQNDRMWKLEKNLQMSALPAVTDVEFPKDWKEISDRRLRATMTKLTAKEKKIVEALDKPMTINLVERPLDEALQDLSNSFDLPLLIDKKSLEDLGLDLKKGVSLQGKGLSGRTILRSILATQGLTFVIKDETIQIVTVEKAQNMLTTRVYYLGDIVQSGAFSGPEWGPLINGLQTADNAKVLTDMIKKSVEPLMWKENGGPGSVTFHFPSRSIIVRASSEVHLLLGKSFGSGR